MPEPAEKRSRPLEPGHRGYVAGVLDCDGSIWIGATRSGDYAQYTLRMSVTNTRRPLPAWFAEQFGGECKLFKPRNAKWKAEYRWQAAGLNALPVLSLCLPYLIIKRQQALLAIEFASTIIPGSRALPESYRELRKDIHERMCALNKRGPA